MQASQATILSDSVIEILNHCKVAAWPQPQIPGSQVELHSLTRISFGRGGLASLRHYQAPAGSWTNRPCAIPAWHCALPACGSRGRSFRPPKPSDNLLRRLRAGLRIAAGYGMASRQVGACDLCDRGFSRHCSHVQLAGKPGTPPAVGGGRAFSKCSGMELEHLVRPEW